jgi:cytochrome b561
MQENKKITFSSKQTIGYLMMLLLPITGLLLLLIPEPPVYFWVLFAIGCPLLFLGNRFQRS